jgi:hypothetical protein
MREHSTRCLYDDAARWALLAWLGVSAGLAGCSGTAGGDAAAGSPAPGLSTNVQPGVPAPGAGSQPGVSPTGVTPPGATSPGVGTDVPGVPSVPGVPGDPASPAPAATPQARLPLASRITKTEYAWSVLDVLGVELTEQELSLDAGGLPDDQGDGVFKRFADKQTTVEQHASGLFALAELTASRVAVATLSATHGACTRATLDCVQPILAGVGERLFRRPLDERETALYEGVAQTALTEDESFEATVRWTLVALLQAPSFVFQMTKETVGTAGAIGSLDAYELGARLASFIWSSVPDAPLLEAAADGSLLEPAALQAQVTRMLADPKAQRMTENFIRDYSRAERASFLDATDADRAALRESIVATFQYLMWDAKRPLHELFTTTDFVVNTRTAELLGVDAVGPGLTHVDVSSLPERRGLLTHPGVIAGMGDQETGSFVNRGKFLMERLLCQHPAAVPAALVSALEEFNADTTGLNEHERMEIRKTRPECWGCHMQFEPFAFGFARFDGAGRYVGEADAAGKPLPLDGWVPVRTEADAPKYTNVSEYMAILQSEKAIQECMTQHFISYATSFAPDKFARAAAPTVGAQYVAEGQTLGSMISAVVRSDVFRQFLVQSATAESEEN